MDTSASLHSDVSPHTGKRRRAPYSREVCDFCRDSKKRCQLLPYEPATFPAPSSAASSPPPPVCLACSRAHIPCKWSKSARKLPRRPSPSPDTNDALSTLPSRNLPPPRVSRFDASIPWLAPLSASDWQSAAPPGQCGEDGGSFITVRLVRDMPRYFTSYFRLVNDGLYPYLDERQFMLDHAHIVVERVLSPDAHWTLAFHSVMAIGARVHGDLSYAQHCSTIALRTLQQLSANMHAQPPSRLALTFRALLALSYYNACAKEEQQDDPEAEDSVERLLSAARSMLSLSGVSTRLPEEVTRLADSIPQFSDAFLQSPYPACSVAEQLRYQRQHYPYDQKRHERLELEQAMAVGASQGGRIEVVELARDSGGSSETARVASSLGAECEEGWDCSSGDVVHDLHLLNSALAGDSFLSSPVPVQWSIYQALIVLLRAERSDRVRGLQLTIVFGRRAQCYLLLGQIPQAVRAARQTLREVAVYDAKDPLCTYPPNTVLLIRALVIVRTLDKAHDTAALIEGGLVVLRKLAALWPALQRHLTRWTASEVSATPAELPTTLFDSSANPSLLSPLWSPTLLLPSVSDVSNAPELPDLLRGVSDFTALPPAAYAPPATPPAGATPAATAQWFSGAELDWSSITQASS